MNKCSNISVDEIIEKVLIRPKSMRQNRSGDNSETQRENIFNYELQEENEQLRKKLNDLNEKYLKIGKKRQQQNKSRALVEEAKSKLATLLSKNSKLLSQISKVRLKNSKISESIENELVLSKKTRRSRECECISSAAQQSVDQMNNYRRKNSPKNPRRSPSYICIQDEKSQISQLKLINVALQCDLKANDNYSEEKQKKKEFLSHLNKIKEQQERLLDSYEATFRKHSDPLYKQIQQNIEQSKVKSGDIKSKTKQLFRGSNSIGTIVKIKKVI